MRCETEDVSVFTQQIDPTAFGLAVTHKNEQTSVINGRVERIVPGGLGLMRDEKGVFFVRGVLPGEAVQLSGFKKKGGARFGVIHRIVEKSENRAVPDCDAHPRCGGCDLLDFDEVASKAARQSMIRDALSRIGNLPVADLNKVQEVRLQTPSHGRRRRCQIHSDENGKIGFFARDSRNLVERNACLALTPALNEMLKRVSEMGNVPANSRIYFAVDDQDRLSMCIANGKKEEARAFIDQLIQSKLIAGGILKDEDEELEEVYGDPNLFGEIAFDAPGGPFRSDAATFTQATRHGAREISAAVHAGLDRCGFENGPILELFAGAGHLTLSLAARSSCVMAVEGAWRSVTHLLHNMDLSPHGDQIQCIWGEIDGRHFGEDFVDVLWEIPEAIVMDPPRIGVPQIGKILDFIQSPILILVSCDVATGARDLKTAMQHGYELVNMQPIDAFPRTSHTEWVAALRLKG
jgi:23S rRNA (uracil1939-C5)-methyltransferase